MTISHYLPLNVDDLVAKELLDPELLFVRIERVCKDLPDGDCDGQASRFALRLFL